jgi:signal transduction histidine kinase
MKPQILIIPLLMAIVVLAGPGHAQNSAPPQPSPLVLTDGQGEYPLGLHLEILADPQGTLNIKDVIAPEYDAQFVPSQVPVPNYGFTNSAYWVRLNLDNQTQQVGDWLLDVGFANMHYIDLYTPLPDGQGFTEKQTGVLRPISTRSVDSPHIVLELPIPPHTERTFYLRFQNGASMTLPLTLWTQPAFLNHSLIEQISMGIFYGALLGLLFYNLFLLFSLRDKNYLYFVILLACMILEQANYDGYLVAYIVPNLYSVSTYFERLFLALLIVSIILFSDSFLEVRQRLPIYHKINLVIFAIWGGLVLLAFFTSYHFMATLMAPMSIFSLLVVIAVGILSWRQGFRPARFFIIAWLGLVASLVWIFMVRLGITSSTFLGENFYRLGYIWMAVCWAIALADRINLLKEQTETANRELKKSENRLSQILEGLPLGVVVYGNDQKPSYINKRVVDILSNPAKGIIADIAAGRTLAQALKYYSFKIAGSDQDYPLESLPVYSALHGEPASVENIEADLGDKRIPLEIWASPVKDDTGKVDSAVVAFQDISQRKRAEAELINYHKRLESLVEERTTEVNAVNERLQLHNDWLTMVNKIHQTIVGVSNLPKAYAEMSSRILELLGARSVFILRWENQNDPSEFYSASLPEDDFPENGVIQATFRQDSSLRQDIELGETIVWSIDQKGTLPVSLEEFFGRNEIKLSLFAPIKVRQNAVGVLGVILSGPEREGTIWQQEELVGRMAFDLGDLTEDAILLDQALILAQLDERNRLARDLHDSVTQALFSATLLAEVLPQIWRRDPELGVQKLDKLRQLTRGALAEMRTLLLELRPSAVIHTPLSDLLAQLAEATTSRSGLEFKLYLEQVPMLPENVQIGFYRIAQEALNNVVKHAQARLVTLSLSATPLAQDQGSVAEQELRLVIQDDGVGFSSGNGGSDRFGIGIMQERAAAIQASFSLVSQPGRGAQMTLIWCGEVGSFS